MEEASQTLRASKWQVFKTVTLPLMRPGIANAFLLGFIESLADFGNPLVPVSYTHLTLPTICSV